MASQKPEMPIKIDQIIRSSRKSIGLEISSEGRLIVRTPYFTPKKVLEKVINQKKGWILKKQQQSRERTSQIKKKKFIPGELFKFLGKSFPLTFSEESPSPLTFNGKKFMLRKKNLDQAEKLFIQWYKKEALRVYGERITHFKKTTGIISNHLRISNARKRWGSCSSRGNLFINWRLIMAKQSIIDYVIIHELIHVEEKNHGKKFWHKVENLLPGYKMCKKWLKENGHLLTL